MTTSKEINTICASWSVTAVTAWDQEVEVNILDIAAMDKRQLINLWISIPADADGTNEKTYSEAAYATEDWVLSLWPEPTDEEWRQYFMDQLMRRAEEETIPAAWDCMDQLIK